eukprot:NODE_1100_length_669_cov_130.739927_g1091_i0.p1 GENE.NODE_1100_length_669_cov_130.739927_g1091_i0~~NODE_1100_length_669_cov_130.739927_g1091_i0.p1  ORF type:complete len:112 (-),score=9.86 NODE_1100_length_669_cov_130.739927_g1091_i0:100-435(-)
MGLLSEEVEKLNLVARLSFLTACYSGTGITLDTGVSSMQAAFLAAGVATSVGALWPVADNGITLDLVRCFYAMYTAGFGPARAMQIAMITAKGKHPHEWYEWGCFAVQGLP